MNWLGLLKGALLYLLWTVVALGWTAAAYHAGGAARGAEVRLAWQAERTANARAVANALERTMDAERGVATQLAERDEKHRKELTDAKDEHERRARAMRSGTLRVSVPVTAASCTAATVPGPAAAGRPAEARAELAPETAAALDGIAVDGDTAILGLNTCIDRYNIVRDAVNALGHAQAE